MFIKRLIPNFVFSIYHYLLSLMGAFLYGFPSKKMIVIGVTGTNGKTTVVHLITEILALRQAQGKVASLSSIRLKIDNKEWPNMLKMTMPGRFKLQKFLRKAVKAKCKYVVLEVTSEGIKQHRHKFIDFNGAVFTNLTKEHIEAHKGFENYKKAKGKLFKTLNKSNKKNKFAVFNADDEYSEYYSALVDKNIKKYFYAIKNKKAEIKAEDFELESNLPGEFNVYNAMAAICVGISQGINLENVLKALKSIKRIPGRMELVIDEPFKVYVDYAHTPDSLEKVYQAIKNYQLSVINYQLICVLGSCGGGRDKWKRPELGKIASKYCDKIILTNEDPYDENPSSILKDIESGFSKLQAPSAKFQKILDRREAIRKALNLAKDGDVVAITGKGSEPWMCVAGGKKNPWDDRKIVREEYRKLSKGPATSLV